MLFPSDFFLKHKQMFIWTWSLNGQKVSFCRLGYGFVFFLKKSLLISLTATGCFNFVSFDSMLDKVTWKLLCEPNGSIYFLNKRFHISVKVYSNPPVLSKSVVEMCRCKHLWGSQFFLGSSLFILCQHPPAKKLATWGTTGRAESFNYHNY